MSAKKWPPPEFPVIEGNYALTATWALHLPEKFARRLEDGSLVLWRPGLTVWLEVWNNDRGKLQSERLTSIKEAASPARFREQESNSGDLTRFSYRLRDENEDGPVESLYAFIIDNDGHVQLAVYFDDLADEPMAQKIVDSVVQRAQLAG